MARIVLAEHDPAIAEPLARALIREGYEVTQHAAGQAVLSAPVEAELVILDQGLPDVDGLEVARALRSRGAGPPILILTARADEVDLVVGLDAGADDYVTKPFHLEELLARVKALLARTGTDPA